MKLLWQKFRDLPPKKQIWFWLAALIVVTPLLLHSYGFSLTPPEERFRQAEAAEFLGPMEVLGSFETDAPLFDHALVAADEHTAALFLYNRHDDIFLSQEREEDFTLMCAGYMSSVSWYMGQEEPFTLPLILFDRHEKAVWAELKIDAGEMHWTLESVRDGNGWFRFDLVSPADRSSEEVEALTRLYNMTFHDEPADISCTARFYGAAGELIAEESR